MRAARARILPVLPGKPAKSADVLHAFEKHLTGARIAGVKQPYLERILDIEIDALDELGVACKRRIVLEMIGRHSNFILLDGDGRIIDCLKKVDAEMSEARQVLPGMFYRMPPAQDKLDPFTVTREEWERRTAEYPDRTADAFLLDTFTGLSRCCAGRYHTVLRRYGRKAYR